MVRPELDAAMRGTRAGHTRLLETVRSVSDEQAREASILPGWTRGHLLTHLARNADSHVRMLGAAAEGQVVEQYVGGSEGRAADIEDGSIRPATELIEDFESSAERLFELWPQIPEETWDSEVVAVHGGQPAWHCLFSRWRETEIHHVDLDLGYGIDEWPDDFVDATLPHLARSLEGRVHPDIRLGIISTDLGFATAVGDGTPEVVRGPARAILAWLAGRPYPEGALRAESGSVPRLKAWI